jgi:periplasmic copper chaperone A
VKLVHLAAKRAVFLVVLSTVGIQAASAQPAPGVYRAGGILVEAPWSREAPGGVRQSVGYMRISNTGSQPDRLVGGTAATTGRSEVHRSVTVDGVTRMEAVAEGLEIRSGETVELKPGAMHAMLVDLPRGPKAGEIVKGTLVFEKAGTVEIAYQVGGLGTRVAPAVAGHHPHH